MQKMLEEVIFLLSVLVNADWNPQDVQISAEEDKNRDYFSYNSPSSKEAR